VKEILPDLDLWQSQGEDIALATVVRVRRSAPRPPGARLCITRSGRMSGSVSGGCVEADVFERAMQVLDSRNPEVANYGIADELGFEVGLSCGGSIDVLIEPFVVDAEWESLRRSVEREQEAVYAIGLAPESVLGRKLVRLDASRSIGSIAPSLDSHISDEGEKLLQVGGTKIVSLPYEGEQAQVYMEAFRPSPSLLIVGATHTAMSLCRLADEVGFQVTVIDVRTALATPERFPDASKILHAWPDEALAQVPLEGYSSLVVLTHDPKFDVPALACGLRSQARYIGAQGSRSTHEGRKQQLRQQGFTDTDLARIRAPIGLDIGSRTPAELALAILAEVLAVQYNRA
jgi:xanthine dehydrogenase accessory factor